MQLLRWCASGRRCNAAAFRCKVAAFLQGRDGQSGVGDCSVAATVDSRQAAVLLLTGARQLRSALTSADLAHLVELSLLQGGAVATVASMCM